MKKTWITSAHQGFVKGNVRSNTALAVRFAIEAGADMIETDARTTSDGVLIANHDATVVGVDESGNPVEKTISETTFSDLQKIILSESEEYGIQRVATLEEMISLAHVGGIGINIDLKEGFAHAEEIARMVVSHGMGGQTIYATNGSGLQTIYAILAIDPDARFIDKPRHFNAETLAPYADYRSRCFAYTSDFSPENIAAIRKSGCMLAAISLDAETAPIGLALSPEMAEYPHTSDFVAIEKAFFEKDV